MNSPSGGIGRHDRLKICRFLCRASSILALGTVLSACSTLDLFNPPDTDFPKLEVREHAYQDHYDTVIACRAIYQKYKMSPPFGLVACAEWSFDKNTCDIYYEKGDEYFRQHELGHCKGYDHPGDTTIRDEWNLYRKQREPVRILIPDRPPE